MHALCHKQVNQKERRKTSRGTVSVRRNNRKTTAAMDQSVPKPRPPSSVRGHVDWITSWAERRDDYSPPSVCYIRNLSIDAMIGRDLSPRPAAGFTTVSCRRRAQETPQAILASNSSMTMGYNTPGKYFPSHDTDFPRKSKSCTQVMVEIYFPWNVLFSARETLKKKNAIVFSPLKPGLRSAEDVL